MLLYPFGRICIHKKIRDRYVFLTFYLVELGMLPIDKQACSRETIYELCIMDTLSTKLLNK